MTTAVLTIGSLPAKFYHCVNFDAMLTAEPVNWAVKGRGMDPEQGQMPETAVLVNQWSRGDASVGDKLIERLYQDLSQIAGARIRGERNSSLSTNDLINEAIVRLMKSGPIEVESRAHFIALSSRLMRNILVDHVRQKNSARRQHIRVELRTNIEGHARLDLIELNAALLRLGAIDKQYLDLVEMRYFGGMTVPDIALVTGQSLSMVERKWQVARAWLLEAMKVKIDGA